MRGKPPGKLVSAILGALERDGPMTRAAISKAIGADRLVVSAVVSRLSRVLPSRPKRIYVSHYVYDEEGARTNYPRAVYALGDLPDVKRPKPQPREVIARRYRQRRKVKVSSVWEWAMPHRARKQLRKEHRTRTNALSTDTEATQSTTTLQTSWSSE